jgi:hypothetical protein
MGHEFEALYSSIVIVAIGLDDGDGRAKCSYPTQNADHFIVLAELEDPAFPLRLRNNYWTLRTVHDRRVRAVCASNQHT